MESTSVAIPCAISLYTREALMVHDTLDALGVPRFSEGGYGERLSMSQRMKLMHDAVLQLNVALRKWREQV